MKKFYALFCSAVVALFAVSCEKDSNNTIDQVLEGVDSGAVLRTINVISGELPIGVEGAKFEVEVEAQDNQNGDLLQSVDVFVALTDNSPDNGDSSAAEVQIATVDRAAFSPGPFGLPRGIVSVSLDEMLGALGVTEGDLFGGDVFNVRLALNLTDGRVFSVNNAGGIITGGFFNSPFQYAPTVICPVEETYMVGEYLIEEITPYVDGPTFDDGSIVTVSVGDFSTERFFLTSNYPDYCTTPNDFRYTLVCGNIIVPLQESNCACGSGADYFGPPLGDASTYDLSDDTVFFLTFGNDLQSDCVAPEDTTYKFTKQ